MEERERKKHRAVNFDLSEEKLITYYSATNPKSAYGKISNFFEKRNFEHRQYSGYRSKEPMSDAEIMTLMNEMFKKMPWLDKCAEKMDVTTIESVYDVLQIRKEACAEAAKHMDEKMVEKETKPIKSPSSKKMSLKNAVDNKKQVVSQREETNQTQSKHKSVGRDL